MKNIKKSIFFSMLSLVLCVAMLIGTTFAWFTDSASSGVNRIQAGNLDIDLLMDKGDGNYISIAGGTGDIFKEADKAQNSNATLWEPGKTQFAKLAVENKGSLAVKYTAYIDVTDNGLANALEYALVSSKTLIDTSNITSWEAVKTAVTTAGGATGSITAGRNTIATGVLDEITKGTQNEKDYVLLAVHMKEEAGNEYQGKDATIDVTIVATQKDAESDSFGNQYDVGAYTNEPNSPVHETSSSKAIAMTTTASNVTKIDGTSVIGSDNVEINSGSTIAYATVPVSAAEDVMNDLLPDEGVDTSKNREMVLNLNVDTTETKEDSITYEIGVTADLIYTDTTGKIHQSSSDVHTLTSYMTATINIGKNLKNVKVTHSGNEMTAMESADQTTDIGEYGGYHYNESTGILTIKSTSFSPFKVSYVVPDPEVKISKEGSSDAYMTLAAFRDSVNDGNTYAGYTVTLLKDVNLSDVPNWTSISTTDDYSKAFAGVFDGANHTISNMKTTDGEFNGSLFGSVTGTIKNLTLKDAVVNNGRGTIATLGARGVQIINCHLINCHMTTNGSAGLFLGYVDEVDNALIKNCSTDADSYLTNSSGYQSAGIVGQVCSGINSKTVTIEGCINNANISGYHSVGGIVGQLGAKVESATIKDCTNKGTITLVGTTNTTKYVGGIIGYRNSGSTSSGTTVVTNCKNEGIVTSTVSGASIGGFIGFSNTVPLQFTDCASSGSVGASDATNVGGYIGWLNGGTATFDACSTSATLTGGTNKGNYIGNRNGTVTINPNCNPTSN